MMLSSFAANGAATIGDAIRRSASADSLEFVRRSLSRRPKAARACSNRSCASPPDSDQAQQCPATRQEQRSRLRLALLAAKPHQYANELQIRRAALREKLHGSKETEQQERRISSQLARPARRRNHSPPGYHQSARFSPSTRQIRPVVDPVPNEPTCNYEARMSVADATASKIWHTPTCQNRFKGGERLEFDKAYNACDQQQLWHISRGVSFRRRRKTKNENCSTCSCCDCRGYAGTRL